MSQYPSPATRVAALLVACAFGSVAAAQTAVMLDGRVLTPKNPPEAFATEGPIWNLDLANQSIIATGKPVTIPLLVNGAPLLLFGSSVLGQDGIASTGIGAADFDRLVDSNAIGTDRDVAPVSVGLGPRRLGPTRSIFSTSEGRRATDATGFVRDPAAQAAIEQNYFNVVQATYARHAAALPLDFLDRAGLRGTDPANWTYPTTAGGTLKSEGQVYVDAQGNEFFVPDVEVVIELSENVAGGTVTSVAAGNATTPDSFVVGELLVIFNQDPRFGADVLGLGDAPIPRAQFLAQALGNHVDTIGHMVGEHVLFVQEVLTELTDPTAGITITADRFRLRTNRGEARWIGTVDKPQGITLFAILGAQQFVIPLQVDALTGGATYSARINAAGLAALTEIRLEARNAQGVVQASETFNVTAFKEP